MYIYAYIYIYRERKREREREIDRQIERERERKRGIEKKDVHIDGKTYQKDVCIDRQITKRQK